MKSRFVRGNRPSPMLAVFLSSARASIDSPRPQSCDIITAVRENPKGATDESTRCADHPLVAIRRRRVLLGWPESRRESRRAYSAHPAGLAVDWPTAIDSHAVSLLRGPSPDQLKEHPHAAWQGRRCGIR